MEYVVLVLVVGGFGYFIYNRIKKNNLPSGGTGSGSGSNPGGSIKDNVKRQRD